MTPQWLTNGKVKLYSFVIQCRITVKRLKVWSSTPATSVKEGGSAGSTISEGAIVERLHGCC